MAKQDQNNLSEKERARIWAHFRWMDSLPTRLSSPESAFDHISDKINLRAYDHLPTTLGDPEKAFAHIC